VQTEELRTSLLTVTLPCFLLFLFFCYTSSYNIGADYLQVLRGMSIRSCTMTCGGMEHVNYP
jgi:hypothetical protein